MRKLTALLCTVVLVLTTTACNPFDDRASKSAIFRAVTAERDALIAGIENGELDTVTLSVVQSVEEHGDHIEFYCGGAGMGSSTAYRGFFYTEADDRCAVWCAPVSADSLAPDGNGYSWEEANGDNRYYCEKICDNFWYYEAEY